eukprot:gene9784-6861_t
MNYEANNTTKKELTCEIDRELERWRKTLNTIWNGRGAFQPTVELSLFPHPHSPPPPSRSRLHLVMVKEIALIGRVSSVSIMYYFFSEIFFKIHKQEEQPPAQKRSNR